MCDYEKPVHKIGEITVYGRDKLKSLEKENAELKARLAHVESELEKSNFAMNAIAAGEARTVLNPHCRCKDVADFVDYARQRIKERKEF